VANRIKLTQATVEREMCPPERKDKLLFDDELKGFCLRVTKSGSKIFLAQYAVAGSKRRMRIGEFGTLTAAEARREARSLLGAVARGEDPHATRKAATKAAQAAKEDADFTFARMVQAWSEARRTDRRESYITEAVNCLARNLPHWQDRPASGVSYGQAVKALDAIKAQKSIVAANRTLAYARAAYGWSVRRQEVPMNPFLGIERPGRESPRERVLSADELAHVWRACDALSPARAAFVRLLMLTLQRSGEIASMRWSELDNQTAPTVWTLPAERAKNARSHIIHLSEPARAIIRSQPVVRGNPFVLAGASQKPIEASHTKEQIQAALARLGAAIPDWRFHDFRRSGVTALAAMGVPPHVADKLLNHVTGAIQGVAAVYQRHEFMGERQAALTAWAEHVLGAVRTAQTAGVRS
jgi:integrase